MPRILRSVSCVLCFIVFGGLFAIPSTAQTYQGDMREPPGAYHESALRRFEIIFTVSLPFTALHSYMAVRGVEMARQRKISPEISDMDWRLVGGITFLYSGFIGFWDWLHTRNEDISELEIAPSDQLKPLEETYNTPYSMLDDQKLIPNGQSPEPIVQFQLLSMEF